MIVSCECRKEEGRVDCECTAIAMNERDWRLMEAEKTSQSHRD